MYFTKRIHQENYNIRLILECVYKSNCNIITDIYNIIEQQTKAIISLLLTYISYISIDGR